MKRAIEKEPKLRQNWRIDVEMYRQVSGLASKENRLFSQMLRTLLKEALEARGIKQ